MKIKLAVRLTLCMLLALTVLFTSCTTDIIEIVKVSFNTDGGSAAPADMELNKGDALGFVAEPTKAGFVFIGWFNGYDLYNALSPIYNDVLLTAKWKLPSVQTAVVTFDAPGWVPELTAVEVPIGSKLGPFFPDPPRMEGFIFMGWADAGGTPFTFNSTVPGNITVSPLYDFKMQWTVTLSVPAVHQSYNPGIHGKQFVVYDGESINEWSNRFPSEMFMAPDPNDFQFHQFFRWAEDGKLTGIIYNANSPIHSNFTLGAVYGLYFHKASFNVDLSTVYDRTSMNEFRVGEFWEQILELELNYPMTNAEDVISNPWRCSPERGDMADVVDNGDGSITLTCKTKPTLICFRTPEGIWKLLKYAQSVNDTKVSFEIDYEFPNPGDEQDNVTNVFFGNLMNNDNWNSTEVRDLPWKDITDGIDYDPSVDPEKKPELHKLAGTIINFEQNVDWLVFRAGRENTRVPFDITIKSIKVNMEQ